MNNDGVMVGWALGMSTKWYDCAMATLRFVLESKNVRGRGGRMLDERGEDNSQQW